MSSSPTKRSRKPTRVAAPKEDALLGSTAVRADAVAAVAGGKATIGRKPASLEMRNNIGRILSRFVPAHIVIDSAHKIMQLHGNAGRYLELPSGGASLSLLTMLRPGLLIPLRTAIEAVREHGASVRNRGVKVQTNSGLESIDIEVTPVQGETGDKKTWFVVVFEPIDAAPTPRRRRQQIAVPAAEAARTGSEVLRLQTELAELRESLRLAVMQQNLINGELQSANAEVQSANEELQSINEELETSREQLQSSNEELMTVNHSLLERTAELERIISELNSLLESVHVAALVLDTQMRIKSFTAAAEDMLNVIRGDVGRPLRDLSLCALYPNLEAQLREVLMTGNAKTLSAHDKNGHRYQLQLRPYLTEKLIDGVTIVADAGRREHLTG